VDLKELVTPSAAGRLAGCSAQNVRVAARSGKLPCVETPLGKLFSPDAIKQWRDEIEGRRKPSA